MSKEQGSESAVSRSQYIKEEEMAEEKEASKKLSRREFVKKAAIGAAGAGAVGAVGALASCAPAAPGEVGTQGPAGPAGPAGPQGEKGEPANPVVAEEETDVLVVGMGFAGLNAANRAADSGVRVTLIEKIPKGFFAPGGCVVMSGLSCGTVGLSLAAPEDEIAEMLAKTTANRAPTEMIRAYAGNANRAIEWLQGCGVEFMEQEGGPTRLSPRAPAILNNKQWGLRKPGGEYDSTKLGGKVAAELLLSRLEDMGATILFETPARKLLTNDKGEVVGAEVKTKDGLVNIKAKAVILCTGGILQNQEMVSRYFGAHAAEMIPYVPPGVTGDGFEMARKVGAAFRMPTLGGGVRPIPEEALWNEDHLFNNLKLIGYYGMFVDEYGNRSFDETMLQSEQKNAKHHMMKQTESVTGMVLVGDAAYQREEDVKGTFDRVLQFGGTVYEADTIEEIAEQAQTDALGVLRPSRQQDLVTTVKAFDKAIEEGKNMELRPSRKANLDKIETPPIRAVTFTLMSETFMGGLLVNEKAEVVSKDGGVVPGLYGAGEMMHNSIGGGPMNTIRGGLSYVGCNALCIVFGMLSGENAAEHAKA